MPRNQQPNTVNSTDNYDQFTFLHNNRETHAPHIEALKDAFVAFGNLTVAQPILVNERMEVIDGQHRLVACRELHQPVYYTVVPGLNVEDARQMNLLHRGWGTDDFAHSYASSGITAYQQYLELREQFPKFPHSTILVYLYGEGKNSTGMYKAFREGELVIHDLEATVEQLQRLAQLSELTVMTKPISRAIQIMFQNPQYDHQRMLRKLEATGPLRAYQGVRDNLRNLEDVYNSGGVTEANKVRFF